MKVWLFLGEARHENEIWICESQETVEACAMDWVRRQWEYWSIPGEPPELYEAFDRLACYERYAIIECHEVATMADFIAAGKRP